MALAAAANCVTLRPQPKAAGVPPMGDDLVFRITVVVAGMSPIVLAAIALFMQ